MKRLFLLIPFAFTNQLHGQTPVNNTDQHATKANQNKTIKSQLPKIEISYFDSLKTLKDTVTYYQIIGLRKLNFYSGTIYFAGTYYENVAILKLNSKSDSTFNKYFDRCAPGSKLAFEKVIWRDKNGTALGPLTKLFILK